MWAKKDIETNRNSEASAVDNIQLSWVSHPAADNLKRTFLVIIFLMAIFGGIYLTTESVVLTIVAVLIMAGSMSSFFTQTKYGLNEAGIEIKTLSGRRRFDWGRFRSYYPDKNGVLLSPFVRPSRLENFRGVYIRFAGNREAVVEFIKAKITRPISEGENVVS